MNSKRLSIYVSSPDSYSDVFAVFLNGYQRYWRNCPYEFILTTNTKTYEGIHCFCNNKQGDSWVERTLNVLPSITSKYILLLCDDIIICDYINNEEIEDILNYMDNNNIRFCRLKPYAFNGPKTSSSLLLRINKQTPYAVNIQIGIFRKDYFEELLGDGSLSAWDIEDCINQKAAQAENEFYDDVVVVSKEIIPHIHGVMKGGWIRTSVKKLRKKHLCGDLERSFIPWSVEFKYNLIRFISPKISLGTRRLFKKIAMKFLGVHFTTKC